MASLSIGEALAALAILLLLPSILNPLVRFRLTVSRFHEAYIYIVPFVAFLLVVTSYIIPEGTIIFVSLNLNEALRVTSSVLFSAPIFAIGYAYFGIPKFSKRNHQVYLDGVIGLVSRPDDLPQDFAKDMEINIANIISVADGVNWRKGNENAFYAFSHRKVVEYGRNAYWLTEVCLDKKVMEFLISTAPSHALRRGRV